ncbi:hypothetical protein F5890DRAFT_383607 [Lentinula detonsa]|uniref:Uncharacterized protein n=1 Tax=Lentinula detonsa TaxID=2804962 RepID=A0AA38UXT9_9AGAR|nr:hypothetical protein F5890DRAFT_383607 [Lentinula detonsa]
MEDQIPDDELSEEKLRQLYDEEEISRFLQLFAAHVTEVQLPESMPAATQGASVKMESTSEDETCGLDMQHSGVYENEQTLSQRIAFKYILPLLPPPPLPPPPFALGRLRLATQRLYLSIWPVYVPFFHHLAALCTWKHRSRSARYCMIFWMLWYYDLLLPTFFFRLLYALMRRRIFTYPTVTELRQRRKQVDKANELGEEISIRLSTTSFGLTEMWRISRIFTKSKKSKAPKPNIAPGFPNTKVDDPTVLDDTEESQKETDMKRAILQAMNDIADLHERIKNIFIWRRPASSKVYGTALCCCCILTLFCPAQYIAKLVYFLGGVFFWHIIPILAALPPEDRARIPPAFQDAPTDAEFAMEVISQRIAAGLDINPPKVTSKSSQTSSNGVSATIVTEDATTLSAPATPGGSRNEKGKDIDWKKWGERAAIGKAWVVDRKIGQRSDNLASSATVSQPAPVPEVPLPSDETHVFPCQHTSSPGLLTLTRNVLFFNPIASTKTKVAIPLTDIRGVKKTGLLRGLTVKWIDLTNDEDKHKEEVFPWVGGRDEIFARLIGTDVKRWMKL